MKKNCIHCGLPSAESDFCCFGCKTAYALIHSAGLEAVYRQPERNWKAPTITSENEETLINEKDFLDIRAPLQDGIRQAAFPIEGITCASCIWIVERISRWHPEVLESRVDFGQSILHLRWKEKPFIFGKISKTLASLGYRLSLEQVEASRLGVPKREWIRLGVSGASAAGAMHIGLILIGSGQAPIPEGDARMLGYLVGLTALPALTYGAMPFFRKSWQSLKLKHLSSDILIVFSIIWGSFRSLWAASQGLAESYFDALSMIVFLLLGGRILVSLAKNQVVKRPLWLARKEGKILPADSVSRDDRCEVRTGEIVPLDGKLESKDAWVDLSSVTGESLPVRILKNQKIFQGTRACSAFIFRAEKSVADSSWEKLYSKLSRAKENENWSFDWESVFTIGVLSLSFLPFILHLNDALSKAIAVLIVSCPCAIQLSLPLVLTAFRRESLQRGIALTHWSRAFSVKKPKIIYFDKTGTLTLGRPRLIRTQLIHDKNDFRYEAIVYELAVLSDHPLSRVLALEFVDRPRDSIEMSKIEEIPGLGMRGLSQGRMFELKKSSEGETMATSLWVDGEECVRFLFEDSLRFDAKEIIKTLKETENYRVGLLSGDRQEAVQAFVNQVGISFDEVMGGLSPEQKASLQSSQSVFVGDGLNDALAMKSAGLGIGFRGSAESNLAAADFHLLKHDLKLVPDILRAVHRARASLQMNFWISLLYNSLVIAFVFLGYLGPIICAIFMPLSSLTVIAVSFMRKSYSIQKTKEKLYDKIKFSSKKAITPTKNIAKSVRVARRLSQRIP